MNISRLSAAQTARQLCFSGSLLKPLAVPAAIAIRLTLIAVIAFQMSTVCCGQGTPSAKQLQELLKKYPAADTNGDGTLSRQEALAYRRKLSARGAKKKANGRAGNRGIRREFKVDPGWELERFPEDAVCYRSPSEIAAIFDKVKSGKQSTIVSYPEPDDGALRVVGIGHSFMMPGYKTLPAISQGAGMKQPLYTHVGGGITGSARYKWEQENGIFQFAGRPVPKLLSSISGAQWDAMMFGPYYNDRPVYYSCWIDFCLKFNPDMKFYLSDAWPQLEQLGKNPESEAFFTEEVLDRMGSEKRAAYDTMLKPLMKAYPGKVFILPTSDAMVLAAKHFIRGELPGIEGLHRVIGGKERSLWRDQLGHLGPGLERLEGYVFYATLYQRSPERIKKTIPFGGNTDFPSLELDRMFRKIAWQAVTEHPFSGVTGR